MHRIINLGSNVVDITYRPNIKRKNMISSFTINGTQLNALLPNTNFQLTPTNTLIINNNTWTISNLVFDVIANITTSRDHKLAFHIADYLFNIFNNTWVILLNTKLILQSVSLINQVCSVVWQWEKTHGINIHKGTPYYFLALSYAILNDWDSAFVFVFNAIEEDKKANLNTTSPQAYQTSPAYRYATLVNRKDNAFYSFIEIMKKWLRKKIQNFNKKFGTNLRYSDVESKFLHQIQLEETVFLFVYQIQYLISQNYVRTKKLRQNDFSQLRNLNTIFNLCLIVDKLFEYRYLGFPKHKRDSIARNIYNFFDEFRLLGNENNAGDLKGSFTSAGFNIERTPNYTIRRLLARRMTIIYNGYPISSEMKSLLLVWSLRNYGGHNVKAQKVLVTKYEKIIEQIMFALFLALY